jgi:IclR family transcriptional regulator, KDG regulon repressor
VVAEPRQQQPQAGQETSLGRGLEILLTLGGQEAASSAGLGVVRIAKLVGREKSQVSRALKTLAESGLVDRDPESLDYRLGWRLFTLAARAGDPRLLVAGGPWLERLVRQLGETAHLSVLDGAEVLTVLSEPSPSAVRASDWTGRRAPAYCTSSGRVLLFDHDRRRLEDLLGGDALPPRGLGEPRDVADLHRRIVAARVRGYALVDQEFEHGLVGAAAPVRDFRGRIIAALNVSGPKFRFGTQLETTGGPEIKRAADELSRQLGWSDDRAPRSGGDDG